MGEWPIGPEQGESHVFRTFRTQQLSYRYNVSRVTRICHIINCISFLVSAMAELALSWLQPALSHNIWLWLSSGARNGVSQCQLCRAKPSHAVAALDQ